MIKAVVVDDERLVRKGFISLIDWASFGVVIVGEAGDGNAALALLREQEADLLFVDITMPGMTGFELIRQVRMRFPAIRCVVLTCHHEFDYVQEALRLGAVDYIVKTLLEVENADETIRRLVERVKWEDRARESLSRGEGKVVAADRALLYLPLQPQGNEEELFGLSIVKNHPLLALKNMWLTPLLGRFAEEEARRELKSVLGGRWSAALVCGLKDRQLQEVEEVLGRAAHHALFYYEGTEEPARLDYAELKRIAAEENLPITGEDTLDQALNLRWALDREAWETFIAHVQRQQPGRDRIAAFGAGLLHGWTGLILKAEETAHLEDLAVGNLNWTHWKNWLRQFSGYAQRRMLELGLSKEVMFCLIRAVRYMRSHAGDKINQGDVAAEINMSRGYFSQCFARFAGETFGESLRGMRLELAKSLLLETHYPVCEIAGRSGFEDDRYFSRLFRERVGKLPSEYRAEGIER
ncbi:response regulator [Paenibacillus sp. HW567]|uniref:response regulator n=1 Tax=Paenibacillus sp. HW567 TaxID=1034769 RepID=UPI00037A8C08|nr:response regulator [Paenibacillus sp. HW567]